MEIRKLYKPQRMGNLESVIAYSGEEEDPDAQADAEKAVNADSTSTGVSHGMTPRGFEGTLHFPGGRTTGRIEARSPIGVTDDSLFLTYSFPIPFTNTVVTIETAIARGGEVESSVHPPPGYIVPNQEEYDNLGRKRTH